MVSIPIHAASTATATKRPRGLTVIGMGGALGTNTGGALIVGVVPGTGVIGGVGGCWPVKAATASGLNP